MTTPRRVGSFVALLLLAFAAVADAQGGVRARPGAMRPNRRLEQQGADGTLPAQRLLLERQIRRTFWKAAKLRIGFTDDQMLRLERTTQRFDVQRRDLGQEEKAQRVALRAQIIADTSANQSAIASALDQLHEIQRRRLDLQADEQREFASFMTPLQRAKFMAMQEQVRRRMQELVRARPDSSRELPERR